jgi:hypothetical protein
LKIFNCLKNIFRQSKENSNDFHPVADNNIPREISDTENIARFIFSPINVNPKNDNLKPNCFKPPAGNDEVSVNRYDFTNENFLKKIALQMQAPKKEFYGLAMVKAGISADRLSSKGFGESKPVSSNDSTEGKAQNRRVEFVKM